MQILEVTPGVPCTLCIASCRQKVACTELCCCYADAARRLVTVREPSVGVNAAEGPTDTTAQRILRHAACLMAPQCRQYICCVSHTCMYSTGQWTMSGLCTLYSAFCWSLVCWLVCLQVLYSKRLSWLRGVQSWACQGQLKLLDADCAHFNHSSYVYALVIVLCSKQYTR